MLTHLFYPWGLILQGLAVLHFVRRRPDSYWLYIILFLGPIGALIYIFAEALPDVELVGAGFKAIPRNKRIRFLEVAIQDNPSVGNLEELGDLYFDAGKFQLARDTFNRAVAARSETPDCFYHRAICALKLNDAAAAVPDLELVLRKDPNHDFQRARGLLAHAYALTGQKERAEAQFQMAVARSTLSETYINYARFLATEGRSAEAREWAQKVLDKKRTMPRYLKRRERPWFRSAAELVKKAAVQPAGR